jgi:CheY-like chemotaxis protein
MHGPGSCISEPCAKHVSVLIVEDEKVSRNALSSLLNACGYKTHAVASGEEALRRLTSGGTPQVALIDVDLPGMSGLELAAALERTNPQVYTVLITAAAGDRIERFREGHQVGYLRKPLDFPDLLSILSGHFPSTSGSNI